VAAVNPVTTVFKVVTVVLSTLFTYTLYPAPMLSVAADQAKCNRGGSFMMRLGLMVY
jgi:hypothetical protein